MNELLFDWICKPGGLLLARRSQETSPSKGKISWQQNMAINITLADTTITMIAYILLAFRFRYDNYESMGALFRTMNAESLQKTIDIRLWEMFVALVQTVCQLIEKDIDEVMELILRKPEFKQMVENVFSMHYKQAC